MKILICGMGEIGTHSAEFLSRDTHAITAVDRDQARLDAVADAMDIRVVRGQCASAALLTEAGAASADLVLATTDNDEVNLVTASVAKGLGAKRTVAHVRHADYHEQTALDYGAHFGIDHIVSPHFATASAIARSLRNPAAIAIEHFAAGRIEMHEVTLTERCTALGRPLAELRLPRGTRLASVSRGGEASVPEASTVLRAGDKVVLIGNADVFDDMLTRLGVRDTRRRTVVIAGGTPIAVWLCEVLRRREWSIRLFEADGALARRLAEKLPWVTVLHADPTDRSVFAEEQIAKADVFIAVHQEEEENIVSAVFAKAHGVTECVAVVERARYLDLLTHIGVDRAYAPGMVAAKELGMLLDDSPFLRLATLVSGVDIYLWRVAESDIEHQRPLAETNLSPEGVVAAIRREGEVWVPGPEDTIGPGDAVLIVGKAGAEKDIRRLLRGS
jgi:trk system potassium uptake protein